MPFACADSLATKPAFRGASRAGRRCLVITDGFYDWRKSDKQPFCVSLGNKQPMMLAGLWEEWEPKVGEPIRSCTVITTDASEVLAPIHDRMRVIVGAEDWAKGLGEEPLGDIAVLLKPIPAESMAMWSVDRRVGT